MKILHTSDWHLGQTLNGYDRTGEFRDFFRQLQAVVAREKPHVMVVSGDIYDSGVPSTAAQNLYTESLYKLHRAFPDLQTVVVAGNHDSGSRIEVGKELWGCFGVHVIGGIRRLLVPSPQGGSRMETDLQRHIVPITGPGGTVVGYVVAVPYVHASNFPDLSGDTPREQRPQRFFQALLDRVEEQNSRGLPVVMTAHLAVRGGDFAWHEETQGIVGGEECVPLSELGRGFDYLALGHIHKAQTLPDSGGRARYSGSVIPVSFEEDRPHSVSIVEIESRGRAPQIRTVYLETPIPVRTVPKEPAYFEEALASLADLPDDETCYLRLNVKMKDFLPSNSAERVVEALKGKKARYCYIRSVFEETGREREKPRISAAQIGKASPLALAKIYYEGKRGVAMDADLCSMLEEVCRELEQERTVPEP